MAVPLISATSKKVKPLMINSVLRVLLFALVLVLLLVLILLVQAYSTVVTPVQAPPTATPTPMPLEPIDPADATVGRWQWTNFTTEAEVYPPVQLWVDVSIDGVNGVLSIYPDYDEIPEASRTLIQQNGCNFEIESLNADGVDGFFYSPTQARIQVNVNECNVKFYGPVTLREPLIGEFDIAYDAEMTELILHPRELTPIERGKQVFAQYCSGCHGSYAEGLPDIPALDTDQVRGYTDEQLDTIVRNGVAGTTMPAWGNVLSPENFAGVIELIRNIEILNE